MSAAAISSTDRFVATFAALRARLAAALLVGAVLSAAAPSASAQAGAGARPKVAAPAVTQPRWEFLVANGSARSTGSQRDVVKGGGMTAAQLSYVVRPSLALTTTVGWARSRELGAMDSKLDVFTYDVGGEYRAPLWKAGRTMTFRPLVGAGAGARSYNLRSAANDATHNVSAYVSAGGEFGVRRVRVRLEVRDYVTGFTPLRGGGTASARNDIVIMTGLRFVGR